MNQKKSQRIAGIDYGTKRVGIAIADESVGIASPHSQLNRSNEEQDKKFFINLVSSEGVDLFVVGLPVHLDGSESQKSTEARGFGKWLGEATGVPVEYFDERFTTHEADEFLAAAKRTKKKRKQMRDQLAAQIMLSAYLDSENRGEDSLGSIG